QRPKSRGAKDAEKIRCGLADANGARPAELMFPHGDPTHRRRPALDDHGRNRDAIAVSRNAIAQLVIIGEAIHQGFESADFIEWFARHGHYCAQSEVERPKTFCLKNLAP